MNCQGYRVVYRNAGLALQFIGRSDTGFMSSSIDPAYFGSVGDANSTRMRARHDRHAITVVVWLCRQMMTCSQPHSRQCVRSWATAIVRSKCLTRVPAVGPAVQRFALGRFRTRLRAIASIPFLLHTKGPNTRAAETPFEARRSAATNLLSLHVLCRHHLVGHKLRGCDGDDTGSQPRMTQRLRQCRYDYDDSRSKINSYARASRGLIG